LLKAACPIFAGDLKNHAFHRPEPGLRLLSGIDADRVVNLSEGADKLAAQIAQTIHWSDCLQACVESGAVAALELGPGDALCRMLKDRDASVDVRAYDMFRKPDSVKKWLERFN
jgi:[acyl-carrier-protein] S-malonyltransferase